MMKRILNISSEIEAQRIKEILDSNGISHIIRSFHDSAYDGLFQNQLGWGVLEADDADEKLILDLVDNDIAQPLDSEDADIPKTTREKVKGLLIYQIIFALLLVACIFFGYKYYALKMSINNPMIGKNTVTKWTDNGKILLTNWKESGYSNTECFDMNFDENFEIVTFFNVVGKKVSDDYDLNENGVYEKYIFYNILGEIVGQSFDRDEDGAIDSLILNLDDNGRNIYFADNNQDGRYEEIYTGISQTKEISKIDLNKLITGPNKP